jgi:hypothetical protein
MTSAIYQIIIYFLYVSWISFLESWVKLWHVLMDEFGHSCSYSSHKRRRVPDWESNNKKKPNHISIVFQIETLIKLSSLNLEDNIMRIVEQLDCPLVSLYDPQGILLSRCPDFANILQDHSDIGLKVIDGLLCFSRLDTNILLSSSRKTDGDGRDYALEQILCEDPTIPPPNLVFVIGGFLLQFYAYSSPLLLSVAEFWYDHRLIPSHIRFLYEYQVHPRDIRRGLAVYARSQQRNGK